MKQILSITLTVMLCACASIPSSSIELNKKVTNGIEAIRDNGLTMVEAWEKTGYKVLDERWKRVHTKAKADYKSKKNIAAGTALTPEQETDVAGLAVIYRDAVKEMIKREADSLREIINKNASETIKGNNSITNLLEEASRAIGKRQVVMSEIKNLVPIPPSVTDFIDNSLSNSGI